MSRFTPLPATARLALLLASIALAAGQSSGAAVLYVNPDGLCGGNTPCYTDLPAALAAASAGDIIRVQAALYNVTSRIDIGLPVQILGPQAGVNPLPSNGTLRVAGGAGEAVFDGGGALPTLFRILASDVVIDGIEVRNGTGDLIESLLATPTERVALRNNIVHGSSGDEGIQLRNVAGAVIECNHVYGTAGDGINLCCESSDGVIRYNEVHDIASLDALIYVYNASRTTIQANLVYNSANNEGIKLGAKNGTDSLRTGGTVADNVIHDTRQDAIAVYSSNVDVRCNSIYGSTSENGAIYLAFGISNVTVSDNDVHDNVFMTFKWGNPAAVMIEPRVHAASVTVTRNRLVNNTPYAVTNRASALLVAESNWWGAADGPGPVGPGSGGLVSTNVDFDPWLGAVPSPSCGSPGTCGQPPVSVTRTSWERVKGLYR